MVFRDCGDVLRDCGDVLRNCDKAGVLVNPRLRETGVWECIAAKALASFLGPLVG